MEHVLYARNTRPRPRQVEDIGVQKKVGRCQLSVGAADAPTQSPKDHPDSGALCNDQCEFRVLPTAHSPGLEAVDTGEPPG